MKSKLLGMVLLALPLAVARPVSAEHKHPLTEHDLITLLADGVYSSRIEALIEDRGIAFVPTPASQKLLRRAGARESLEHAITVAPQFIPKIVQSRTKSPSNSPIVPPAPFSQTLSVMHQGLALPNKETRFTSHEDTSIRAPLPQNQSVIPSAGSPPQMALAKLTAPSADAISAGTKINMANRFNYQQYMPLGMIELFKGTRFWRMPQDIEINVDPSSSNVLPEQYSDATAQYSDGVPVVHLANGHNDIGNYKGGIPFSNPQEPGKGYKLLADLWYSYVPHILAGTGRNPLNTCAQTRSGYVSCIQFSYLFRQLAYNTDPGVPQEEVSGSADWYTEWMSIEPPDQLKYTTLLTLYPKDNHQPKELYIFLPTLRRRIRGTLAYRCSPVAGTDYAQDDYKRMGFNGGIGLFNAQFLSHQRILSLTGNYVPLGGDFPNNYYMPLGWPKPSWGKWQLRDVDVIDVRRIPTKQAGYCYGKRIIYEDSSIHYALWEDVYDTNMHLWKTALLAQRTTKIASLGIVPGGFNSSA